MRAGRAAEVLEATRSAWRRDRRERLARPLGGGHLVVDREPELIYGPGGDVVGVDAWVRQFDRAGREVRIDPHRRIVNPPTVHEGAQDPAEAFYRVVEDSVVGTPNARGWRTRGTVTTVFADTGDGTIDSSNATYSTARSGSNLAATTSNTDLFIGQGEFGGEYYISEGFLSFDTSAIPDTDNVTAIALALWQLSDESTTDFTLEARQSAWTSGGLTTADWVAGASLGSLTLLASINTSGIGADGAYKTLTSETALLSATNLKTGTVAMLLCSSRHRGNNTPSAGTSEAIGVASANDTGTTHDPKLTITHAGSNAVPMFTSRPARIWKGRPR
ncbi:hypothetical protein [Herbidospora daliensis]|uniref:hypothetical protein n=1 Tax=Herbidospora daliensis TaxID=295585 RepID=UPI00078129DB|nr:hypothetical protein [Herbidospora daliensis]